MIAVKKRDSNIELLRNISMFLILVIHANFVALPHISYEEFVSNTTPSVVRFFIEAIGIVAVNIFVFISGWFGINTRKKSVLSFIYMVIFWLWGGYFVSIVFGQTSFSLGSFLEVLLLTEKDWFIKSYLVLMIIAPVLNAYTNNTNERIQRWVVFSFILFEVIFGWMTGGRRFFVDGFGPLHFIGLYLLAQYIHNKLYSSTTPNFLKRFFDMPKWVDLSVFFVSVIINTIFAVLCILFFKREVPSFWFAYSSPFVMFGSLYLFLFFTKLNLPYNKFINWLGASSFAAFLFHPRIGFLPRLSNTPCIRKTYRSEQARLFWLACPRRFSGRWFCFEKI